jgi:hypothetical protein
VREVMCTICYSKRRDTIVMPCLHMMYCSTCVERVQRQEGQRAKCPCCRTVLTGSTRVFC